jgi:hypothetical protein
MHDTESTVCTLYSLDLYVKITTQPLGIASPIRWLSLVYPLLLCVVSGLHVTRASRQNNASGGYMKPSTTPPLFDTVSTILSRRCHSCDDTSWGSVVAAGHGKMYPHISSLGRNIIQTSGGQTQKRGIFPNRPKHVVMKATGILPTMYIIYSHLYTICSPFPLIAIIVANTDVILHPPNCHAMPGFIRNAYLPRHHIAERGLYSVLCGYVWAEMVNSNQYLIISAATLATCDYHILITCS